MGMDYGIVSDYIGPDPRFLHGLDERFGLFELTLLAEDVDHDVEGDDGGSDVGAEHLGVEDPGLVESPELDEGGKEAVAGLGLGEDLGAKHEVEDVEGFGWVVGVG